MSPRTDAMINLASDDLMVSAFYRSSMSTQFALELLANDHHRTEPALEPDADLALWQPLVSLRHTAQQIMIRNLTSEPHRTTPTFSPVPPPKGNKNNHLNLSLNRISSTSSTFTNTNSSRSTDSFINSPPLTPLWSELQGGMIMSPTSCTTELSVSSPTQAPQTPTTATNQLMFPYHHDRSISFCDDVKLKSPSLTPAAAARRSRGESIMSHHSGGGVAPMPSKSSIQTSLKAAKVLGIDVLSKPGRETEHYHQPSVTSPSKRSSLMNMVDSKLRLFRRNTTSSSSSATIPNPSKVATNLSLRSLMVNEKPPTLQDWVEMQRLSYRPGTTSLPKPTKPWKRHYLVLNDACLFRFSDRNPSALPTATFELTCNSSVYVSNATSGTRWVLELSDGQRVWYLRFMEKGALVLWLSRLKDTLTARTRSQHRHTAPPLVPNSAIAPPTSPLGC